MRKQVHEAVERQQSIRTFKVHARMCSQLLKLVVRVSNILPEVEEARPRCSSGIESLCLLNNGLSKAKSLLHQCNDSSVLYLALTGDAMLNRCKKSTNMMQISLSQIQNMVPVTLAAKISGIAAGLRSVSFSLDPSEEEAGKILRGLIHRQASKADSTESTAFSDINAVASRLRISSRKSLMIEKRSITRIHDKLDERERGKKKILIFFLKLLKMYGQSMSEDQSDNGLPEKEDSFHLPSDIGLGKDHMYLDASTNSVASLSSSLNDLNLQSDHSSVSFGSGQCIDSLVSNMRNDVEPSQIRVMEFLENFDSLPWDSRCKAIEDVMKLLNQSDESLSMIPPKMLIRHISSFLKDSRHRLDVEALTNGCMLLLEAVQKQRNITEYIDEDTCTLLASLLDTEVTLQALSIFEALSFHRNSDYKITSSGALIGVLSIIDSQIHEFQEPALSILNNMSSHGNLHTFIAPSELIPKLIPFLEDDALAVYCVGIFQNMIDNEEARQCIAETDDCIASIAKLLDKDSLDEQERAVSVLLALCSQRVGYCKLVMDEGVISGLFSVSVNGSNRAKSMAMELLRILRIESQNYRETSEHDGVGTDSMPQRNLNPPKAQGLFKKMFGKPAK